MKWIVQESRQDEVKELARFLNTSEVLAKILLNRGIDKRVAYNLLYNPQEEIIDYKKLINIDKGVDEIISAIENGYEIWVFADYDMDGLNSGYIITDFLRRTTSNDVYAYFPDRVDGYGLNMDFCKEMVARKEEGVAEKIMVITVDNGTSCVEEVKFLKENGISILVTDHHTGKEILPDCTIVNPHIDEDKTFHHLSGCATIHKVVMALQERVGMNEDYASEYYFASAMGTVADAMPMTPENIAIVKIGLEQLNGKKCPKAWKTFKEYLGKSKINAIDVAWEIGPRLNATGRMGVIDLGAALFFSEEEPVSEIKRIILEIEEVNEKRKSLTKKARQESLSIDFSQDYVCLFDASEYPSGIVGIIAGKISESEGKVAMAMSGEEVLTGSARAPEWINLQPLFKEQVEKGNLLSYGGHAQAAGFSLKRDRIDSLRASLNERIVEVLESLGEDLTTDEREVLVDGAIDLADINKRNYEAINEFPYDKGAMRQPLFMLEDLRVVSWNLSKNNPDNIKFTVEDKTGKMMSIWAWSFGNEYSKLGTPERIDMIGKIDQDFMSKRSYTLSVEGIRPSA